MHRIPPEESEAEVIVVGVTGNERWHSAKATQTCGSEAKGSFKLWSSQR